MSGILIGILAFVVLITIVVVVHEAGHFVVAKLSGIRVDEFAVGFGPRLFSRRRGETLYSVRALPLGGFVRMPGMLGLEGEADAGERNFYRASIPKRMITILAGIISNFVLGAICLAVVATQPIPPAVTPNGPVAKAGVKDGDIIERVGAVPIDNTTVDAASATLRTAAALSQGNPVLIAVRHPDGVVAVFMTRPELLLFTGSGCQKETLAVSTVNGKALGQGDPAQVLAGTAKVEGLLLDSYDPARAGTSVTLTVQGVTDGQGDGPSPQASWKVGYRVGVPGRSIPDALLVGIRGVANFVGDTAGTLAKVFAPGCAQQFSGPVGIASVAGTSLRAGWVDYLYVIGEISLSLGFVNVLPVPFLDGGRFLFVAIEAVRRRRLNPRHEAAAHAVGLAVLILLFVFITIGDIHNLSSGAGR